MLTIRDKDIMKPVLLAVKQQLLKKNPKLEGADLVDAVLDEKLLKLQGMEPHVASVLIANCYAPDTHKWLMKLIAEVELK